jgi:hypothetical protein
MADPARSLAVYLHLARASDLRRQPLVTAKLLVLAGASAMELDLADVADRCHAAVLARNPRHLLRHWPSFSDADPTERFQSFLKQLRRQYSPEKAEHMLGSLGVDMARERELYANEQEYASALLDAVLRR